MNRLSATLKLDLTLQWRNQLYSITAGVALILIFLLRQVIAPSVLDTALLVMVFFGMAIYYFFSASMLLLERGQHTLAGQIVTPLRVREYLGAKLATLTLLALLENLAIVLLSYGFGVALLPLLAGIVAAAALYILVGLAVVVRYASVTDFLMPSLVYITLLQVPALDAFGLVEHPLFYLHPMQPALVLLRGGFEPLAAWQVAYGVLGALFWAGCAYWWSWRAFQRHVIQQGG